MLNTTPAAHIGGAARHGTRRARAPGQRATRRTAFADHRWRKLSLVLMDLSLEGADNKGFRTEGR